MFESLFEIDAEASEADLRASVEHFERLKSAAAAAQARATALWATKRDQAEAAAGVRADKHGRGLGAEVALARHEAPVCGAKFLGLAKALVHEMPHTLAALDNGMLSEWRAALIVRESACLTVEDRRRLDARLCQDPTRLQSWGNARIEAETKKIAVELDAAAVIDRATKTAQQRCVTIRPAPDAMTYLTAFLPLKQGVAVYAALNQAANTTVDERTRAQIMADTVYERITGRPADKPVPVDLGLVMADTTLVGDDQAPVWLKNYGPIPASLARELATDAALDDDVKATIRRLYRHPDTSQLVAMESRARIFPKGLARFITTRDHTCRTPFCNAPIRHSDHAQPHREGGTTSAHNGLGMCEACNYAKEAPGWTVTTNDTDGNHTAEFTTPTGAVYHSTAPPLPGPSTRRISLVEGELSIDLVTFDAA